jgi:hypothetical protein
MNPDDILPSDLPTQVEIPSATRTQSTLKAEASSESATTTVRAVLKYSNDDGRNAILSVAKTLHHDFGVFNSSLAVSLSPSDLETIKKNPNVDWFEGDGRVIYCSIR